MYAHGFVTHLCTYLCLDLQVECLGSCTKLSEGLTLNSSLYSFTKVAAGGPRAEGPPPGATPGGAEKGITGSSKPGAGTGPSPNTNRTTKMQCF